MTLVEITKDAVDKKRFVGCGLVALDVVVDGTGNLLVPPRAGGSCGNVAAILGSLGWDSTPIARIGVDHAGHKLVSDLQQFGVTTSFLISEGDSGRTPIVVEKVRRRDPSFQGHSYSFRCASCKKWLPRFRAITRRHAKDAAELVEDCSVFYFDRVSPGALELARISRASGALVFFEPSGIGDIEKFQQAAGLAHIVKYSDQRLGNYVNELEGLSGLLQIETRGSEGLTYRFPIGSQSSDWFQLAAHAQADITDEAGSGDWLSAFLMYFLSDRFLANASEITKDQIEEILTYCQQVASLSCRYLGARGMAYVDESEFVTPQLPPILRVPPSPISSDFNLGSTAWLCEFHSER